MTELATPKLVRTSYWSGIWVLPLLALVIGAWLLWRSMSQAGVEILVHFPDGEGIQTGKTQVLYKGIEVGKVIDLHVSPDRKGVDARIRMSHEAGDFISNATRFWLVKPRVSLAGVTGLETLMSGFYIAIDPAPGEWTTEFTALLTPPPMSEKLPGLHLTLKASRLGSLNEGTPVYYRQIQVGQVKSFRLTEDQRTVEVKLYIEPEYAPLVRQHTRFWNASGIQFSGGLSGFKLNTESLLSIATGGIAFATPEHHQDSPPADAEKPFPLYDDFDAAEAGVRVMLKLRDVSGLQPGRTAVMFNGVQVGTLKRIDMGKDFAHPQAELLMDPRTEDLLVEGTEFWTVRPSISLAGVSGLDALLQGNYLAVRFGQGGTASRSFSLSNKAPASDAPGLHLTLTSERLGSLDIGSPLLYRQMRVGSVQGYQLSADRRQMQVSVNVEPEYAALVNSSTRFWNASGISLKGGLSGVEVRSESLQTLLQGGIAFDTPEPKAAPLNAAMPQRLFADEAQAMATGELIELQVERADGLQNGTPLRYRGLEVGRVEQVHLRDDLAGVLLQVRVTEAAQRIARAGSRFRVVRPELGLMRTANLDTLVSGPYLEVEPAPAGAARQTRFSIQTGGEPVAARSEEGLALILSSDRRGSLKPGVPVSYREIQVGKVARIELGPTADRVLIHILIEPRYATLVRSGSRFWNTSGIGVDIGLLKGAQIRTESLETILEGGIAFATPEQEGSPVHNGQTFALFSEAQDEWKKWAPKISLPPPAR